LINQILEELAIHPNLWLGQLLVVLYVTPHYAVFVQWTIRTDPWSIRDRRCPM